jgi:hypothetical protein
MKPKRSRNVKYVTLKNMREYKSLPIICKKTATINEQAVRNNEEFEVVELKIKQLKLMLKSLMKPLKLNMII